MFEHQGPRIKSRAWALVNLVGLAFMGYSITQVPYPKALLGGIWAVFGLSSLLYLVIVLTGDTYRHTLLNVSNFPLGVLLALYSVPMLKFCEEDVEVDGCWDVRNSERVVFMSAFAVVVVLFSFNFMFMCTGFASGILDIEPKEVEVTEV
ncbi:putative transmembrane protein [Gregarina niphandrodes]|uniref:Transmembrane protein n=1 Tax=Gregarina niphandrodes TaxID=110365 RepID=A0A023B2M6_GRENI|nr:putative transmembrane protein [Gregarina niphandrodes]EZG55110.1 putative transmembrane protein [Gregarina niphandrodes]|eukprot:XP_011131772.1 putative transmembrane protein [Gregarina niphandrodes]